MNMTEGLHICPGHAPVSRRAALLGMAATAVLGNSSLALAASTGVAPSPSRPRLVVINVVGGLDGLSVVAPYGDPALSQLRSAIMASPVGTAGGMLDMGGFFGMHPALPNLHAMYVAGEALAIHAVGNSGSGRSHFQGQAYLQSGAEELLSSGWLDRATSLLPQVTASGLTQALALSTVTPLALSGPVRPAGWAPNPFRAATPAFASLVASMTAADPLIGPSISVALGDQYWVDSAVGAGVKAPPGSASTAVLAAAAGAILATPDGPSVAAISTGSFDTHSAQVYRLGLDLPVLDQSLAMLKASLGAAWASTVVLTMTEFGRTAYCNNAASGGTDHGTGFAVLVAGGAVAGGRVLGAWPGLSPTQLLEGRDLAPTTDFRAVAATVLARQFGFTSSQIAYVFPGSPVLPHVGGIFG